METAPSVLGDITSISRHDFYAAVEQRRKWLGQGLREYGNNLEGAPKSLTLDMARVNSELDHLLNVGDTKFPQSQMRHPTSPGSHSTKLADKDRLLHGESMTAWLKSRGEGDLPGNVATEDAWNFFADGIMKGDWSRWASEVKTMAESGSGQYIVPAPLSANVIDRLRASTPIFQAGAQTIPMTSTTQAVARVTGDPTPAWRNELGAVTSSDLTLDRVTFTARSLSFFIQFSRELEEDASNLGSVLEAAIAAAVGVELNRVALRGTGTAPEPRGIRNQTGVEAFGIGANGGPITVDMLIDRYTTVATNNATPNAMILSPRTNGGLTKICKDSQGNYFPLPPPLDQLGRYQTSVVPINLTKGTSNNASEVYIGDFHNLMVGMRVPLVIEPMRERFADTGVRAAWVWVRADIQLAHGEAFSVIADSTT